MSKKSIILVQRHADIIDGEISWGRQELSKEHQWCCEGLKKCPEIFLNEDGKFGFPQYEYKCQDPCFSYTEEIDYCPYCGKKIEVVVLDPIPRSGMTFIKIDEHGWRQKCIQWENGTIKRIGSKYMTYKIKLD